MRLFALVLWVVVTSSLGGCGDDDGSGASSERPTPPVDRGGAEGSGQADEGNRGNDAVTAALRRTRNHLDLQALVHLADVDRGGLYIDFGTPSRMKYTVGTWRNEWGSDGTTGERTFTRLGSGASVYFDLARSEALTLRLRMKRVGTPRLVVYLNGETLRTVELQDGVQDYDVPVAAGVAVRGENQLMLRATETVAVGREQVSVEVDSLRVIPGDAPPQGHFEPPAYGQMVRDLDVGGTARRAVVVSPDTTLRWYAQVPEGAKLSFGLGATAGGTSARVAVTPEDGTESEIFAGPAPMRWGDRLLPLDAFAGKVVRLELSTSGGSGQIGWAGPALVVPLPSAARPAGQARNVVVLTIDTLRADKLRPYNRRTRVRTPVLDAVAADATLFENAQSPENWTKPAVASILTSLFPMTHGTKADAAVLPDAALMLGEVYQAAGFQTGAFLANGYVSDRFGFGQGWSHYTNYIRENRRTEAEQVFGEAARWIEAHRDDRLFVYIQTIDPHVPYDPPDEFLRMYDPHLEQYTGQVRNRMTANLLEGAKRNPPTVIFDAADRQRLADLHDGEISYHDRNLGVFLDKLRELGLYDDMIFVVCSDHGEEFNDHGSWGHGHSIFQELLHVPLFVRWPAAAPGGQRIGTTVSTMDIGPTVLEATGVAIPDVFEGRSLLGWLRGQPPQGPWVAFSDFLDDRRVIRAGRWKLVLRGNLTWTMFDLETDPGETRQLDRRTANPIALRYLRILMGQFLGASDRTAWILPSGGDAPRVLPQQTAQVDAELCRQLRELGYVDARCDAL